MSTTAIQIEAPNIASEQDQATNLGMVSYGQLNATGAIQSDQDKMTHMGMASQDHIIAGEAAQQEDDKVTQKNGGDKS